MTSSQADAAERGTWILTTDAKGFYESVGYKVIAEGKFGLDNPRWHGGPLPIHVVSAVSHGGLLLSCSIALILFCSRW